MYLPLPLVSPAAPAVGTWWSRAQIPANLGLLTYTSISGHHSSDKKKNWLFLSRFKFVCILKHTTGKYFVKFDVFHVFFLAKSSIS